MVLAGTILFLLFILMPSGLALEGDVNGDNVTNITDVIILAQNYHKTNQSADWDDSWDVVPDGVINAKDLNAVSLELFPEYISACLNINQTGTYVLESDIVDSSADACMSISTSEVLLDCRGHLIDGSDESNTYGIRTDSSLGNIIISNCTITDWYEGIYINSSTSNIP